MLLLVSQVQLKRLESLLGREHLDLTLASLPKKIGIMTACSGSGIFEFAATALFNCINNTFCAKKFSGERFTASWRNLLVAETC